MKILVIRFRQLGDAVLATPLLCTLRKNFPDAQIDFVLNDRIAPLFEGHPAISRIITFSSEERRHTLRYVRKVWRVVHKTHYDVIIDMRSTVNTMLFSFFSLSTRHRIGIRKLYTYMVFNYRMPTCPDSESMIDHNLSLLAPLGKLAEVRSLRLSITEKEKADFRAYMLRQGLSFSHPIMLAGVTAKLPDKTWAEERMTEVMRLFFAANPNVQIIFNMVPGKETEMARRIYERLGKHPNIFINVEAGSMRQLAAMAANCTFYFGNEGGARHIAQAMGCPSLSICSPTASKQKWLSENEDVLTRGIAASDYADTRGLTGQEQYDLITVERVWEELASFYANLSRK